MKTTVFCLLGRVFPLGDIQLNVVGKMKRKCINEIKAMCLIIDK